MSIQTTAAFISCTNLVEFQNSSENLHKMYVRFDITSASGNSPRIDLYRYIGPYMNSESESNITSDNEHCKKILTIYESGAYVYSQSFFPIQTPPQIIGTDINRTVNFIDDFTILTNSGTDLKIAHDLTEVATDNATIINDVAFTRRQMFYLVQTNSEAIPDAAPYMLTPDYDNKTFICHSSKTQVKHNYLQYEGDEIWQSDLSSLAGTWQQGGGLSRTSTDITRLYLDSTHAGPTGKGGYAWVSDRSTGRVFRHNLNDGVLEQTYSSGIGGYRGHGIAIDLNTGDCISTPGPTNIYRNFINGGATPTRISSSRTGTYGYGVIPLYGYPDRFVVTDVKKDSPSSPGIPCVLFHGINTATTRLVYGSDPGGHVYAAAGAPNGKALQTHLGSAGAYTVVPSGGNWGSLYIISPVNASAFVKNLYTAINPYIPGIVCGSPRISVDNHRAYPNTIINEDISEDEKRDYFSVSQMHEYGLHMAKTASVSGDVSINWAVKCPFDISYAPCFDGENNLWNMSSYQDPVLGSKVKLYRTAGDRQITTGVLDSLVYPQGGESRYPSTSLRNWNGTLTNTSEIEWFLTRNRGVTTLLNGLANQVVDASSLDDITAVNWDSARPGSYPAAGSQTAQDAWDSMVTSKMYRKTGYSTYFGVYKSNGSLYSQTRKWGARIKIDDIYASDPSYAVTYGSLDAFYSKGSAIWLPEVIRRIGAWADSFADTTLSYIGVTGRSGIIEGNQKGMKVHPFYSHSNSLAALQASTWYYTNPSLSTEQITQLQTYFSNLRYYNFNHLLQTFIYLYSDFSGSLLSNTVENVVGSNDVIHPDTTAPSISFRISGYQSNPGYQDSPSYCYPWSNTAPESMSNMYSGISGYDDFNITYLVSAQMGSYLVTSISVSTDDYYRGYLTDTNNLSSIVTTINPVYNTSGIYTDQVYVNYTYHSPSLNGVFYLPFGRRGVAVTVTPNTFCPVIVLYNESDGSSYTLNSLIGTQLQDGSVVYIWNESTQAYDISNYIAGPGWLPNYITPKNTTIYVYANDVSASPPSSVDLMLYGDTSHLTPATNRISGMFMPAGGLNVIDLYDGTNIVKTDRAELTILERWPEPKFYLNAQDDTDLRYDLFCNNKWDLGRFDKPEEVYNESHSSDALKYDILYGIDPLSAQMLDRSIARTWPVSSWHISLSTSNFRLPWYPTKTFVLEANPLLSLEQDKQSVFTYLSSNVWRYGEYSLTMSVQASTTQTSANEEFTQYIKIADFEPFANFWAVSASTVSAAFVSTNSPISAQLYNISTMPNGIHVGSDGVAYPFISGYAPNLTVYFKESSEAHTFPISAYRWNFGDPFNEGPVNITDINSNYYTITNVQISAGSFEAPCWITNMQGHTAVHTYIMPGTYDVTLVVEASCTGTSDVCARYAGTGDSTKFYVYVEEIRPVCGTGIFASLSASTGYTSAASGVSGNSPLTAYFMSSGIVAGSFPICRMDWDFGDGTVEKITRIPHVTATSQGISLINISAYSYDLLDPRNLVIPHVYNNASEDTQTFDIHVSAYACNTNTMLHCSAYQLIAPIEPNISTRVEDVKRLIGSRFDDAGNLIYIVEGQDENTTYTIALSGELTNE